MKIIINIGGDRMKTYQFKGYLKAYKRLNNSVNGNPCYWLEFENDNAYLDGRTKSDASCGYSCLNWIDRERIVHYHYTRKGNLIIDRIQISGIDY